MMKKPKVAEIVNSIEIDGKEVRKGAYVSAKVVGKISRIYRSIVDGEVRLEILVSDISSGGVKVKQSEVLSVVEHPVCEGWRLFTYKGSPIGIVVHVDEVYVIARDPEDSTLNVIAKAHMLDGPTPQSAIVERITQGHSVRYYDARQQSPNHDDDDDDDYGNDGN